MNIFLREEAYNLVGINYNTIRSNASASQLLSISPAGVISANAAGTYVIASPLVFYSNEQINHAGQIIWGNAETALLCKKIGNCSLRLGVSRRPINGLTVFAGSPAILTDGMLVLAKSSIDADNFKTQIDTEMFPAMEITANSANVPLLEIYSLEIQWNSYNINCT